MKKYACIDVGGTSIKYGILKEDLTFEERCEMDTHAKKGGANILNKVIKEMIKAHPYEEVAYDVYELQNEGEKQGLGRIATLDNEITLEELANKIKDTLDMDKIRLVGDLKSKIKKVALCTGAGSDLVKLSKRKGAQVLITGDMKYHEAQDALDMNMNVIDCGHFDTEDIFKDVMKRFIDGFEEFETIKSEVYLNPFKII